MFSELLPPQVKFREFRSLDVSVSLLPSEAVAVEYATSERVREFGTARRCAREALAELLLAGEEAVPRGPMGEPCWPPGIVGSLTHCQGMGAAAVAHAAEFESLGIDVEVNRPLPIDVRPAVATSGELKRYWGLTSIPLDRLIFSAKESVYKAWFPIKKEFLDFNEAFVSVDPDGTFEAKISHPHAALGGVDLRRMRGRWTVGADFIATAVSVRRR